MQIKNISSSTIKIADLAINLAPGDIDDISRIDPTIIRTHKLLNSYFDKGLLANLGLMPKSSKSSLIATRDRIEKLGVTGKSKNVLVQATRNPPDIKKMVADAGRKNLIKKTLSTPQFDPDKERYSEESQTTVRPRPIIQDKMKPVAVTWTEFGANGNIQTGEIISKTTHLTPTQTFPSELELSITDRRGKEHRISFEDVREKILKKCIGITSTGKPCKKYAVNGGFNSCLTHMNKAEKEEYDKIQSQKSL